MSCRSDARSRTRGLTLTLALVAGCRQEMVDQPRYDALEASAWFEDGSSARPEVPGTLPNGYPPRPAAPQPELTRASLERGRRLYAIHCTACHGRLGEGDGMAVRQGFPRPRPFTTTALLNASDQRLFAALTDGYGVMYGYARLLDDEQRWSITQWIRVLQLSQHAPVDALAPSDRLALERSGS